MSKHPHILDVISPLHLSTSRHNVFGLLFCRSRIARVSFRKVRGLMVFFPFLKFMIAHLATPDRERDF
jgi:hypothetical protein